MTLKVENPLQGKLPVEKSNLHSILNTVKVKELVRFWLQEDCPSFDYAAFVLGGKRGSAKLLCKSPCVLAGVPFFEAIFEELSCKVKWFRPEGNEIIPSGPEHVATVSGPIDKILKGERVALNALSRASGIAWQCKTYKHKVQEAGWGGKIAATRKTTPGFRMVEKYALLVGGADTHRYDLSSMAMLKDNHVWSTGSIEQAVRQVLDVSGFSQKVEVECQNLEEGLEAARSGAHVIMFDNLQPKELHMAARELKSKFQHVLVESSGGITLENVSEYFGAHVDIISTSKLVQGYPVADISLKIIKESVEPMH